MLLLAAHIARIFGSSRRGFRHNRRVRLQLCALSLMFGCVVYDQDVLSTVADTGSPVDLSVPISDGQLARCSRQQSSAPRCLDPSSWVKWSAKTCCDLLQQQLRSVEFAGPCGGAMSPFGYANVGFECCPSAASPSADCLPEKLGGGGECLDESLWKLRAAVACGKLGRLLTGPRSFGPCGPGRWVGIAFDCCAIPCQTSP